MKRREFLQSLGLLAVAPGMLTKPQWPHAKVNFSNGFSATFVPSNGTASKRHRRLCVVVWNFLPGDSCEPTLEGMTHEQGA